MPYNIEKKGEKYFVVSETSDRVMGVHKTEKEAKEQQKALYAKSQDFKKTVEKNRTK